MTGTSIGSGADKKECQKRRQQNAGRLGQNRLLPVLVGLCSNSHHSRPGGAAIDGGLLIQTAHGCSIMRLQKQHMRELSPNPSEVASRKFYRTPESANGLYGCHR